MAMKRMRLAVLGGAALVALAIPTLALWPWPVSLPPAMPGEDRPVTARPVAAVAAVYERDLFAAAEGEQAGPADAPALVGIAGRINRDAVAMVRLADGGSRSLSVGESVDGWRLESLAIDAAFFTRGRERVRVAMETPESGQ